MKSKYHPFIPFISIIAIVMVPSANATTGTWIGAFDGTWDTSEVNWSDVAAGTPWDSTNGPNNTAVFNTASLAAVVNGPVDTNGITFSTTGALSGSTINLAGTTPTIAVAADQAGTISSTVAGSAGLIKSEAGVLTLSNATFTGATTVNGGRLVLGNTLTGGRNYTTNAELDFNLTSDSYIYSGTFSGTGKLIKSGASNLILGEWGATPTVALTGTDSVIDVQGGTLSHFPPSGPYAPIVNWTGNQAGLTVASGATFDLHNNSVIVDELNGSGLIQKNTYETNGSLTIGVNNGSGTFSGTIQNSYNPFELIKQGTGTQRLSGSIGYKGGTTVNGGRLVLENTMTGSGWYTSNAELEFNLTSANQQLQHASFSGTGKIIKTGGNELTLGGWDGAPTVALKGPDSVIDIQEGTLTNFIGSIGWGAAPINWTGNEAGLTVASGATFQMYNNNPVVDELNGGGTIRKDQWDASVTLTIGVKDGSGTFSGAIIQGGATVSLVKQGTGTQTLTGNNNYGGSTTVNAGTLQIGDGGVSIAGTLIFNRSNTYGTVEWQVFSGAGTIIKNGAGDLIFNGGSDHTSVQGISNVVVNDGLIRTDYWGQWNSNLNLTLNGTGKFEMWNTSTSLANLSGNGTLQNTRNWGRSNILTVAAGSFSGAIADSGGDTSINLVKSSAGTLTLSGVNTYHGSTSVTEGTLALVGGSQESPITLSAGASLGFTLGSPTTSTSSFNLTNGTIKITGEPTLTSYTLISASSGITGTPVLAPPIPGYLLEKDGTSLKLVLDTSSGYAAWATGSEPFDGDANGDGVQDGLAWLLNAATPATNALDKLPKPSKDGSFLTLDFQRVNPYAPAKLFVQFGNDLSGWTEVEIPVASGTIPLLGDDVEVEVTSGTFDLLKVKIPASYQSVAGGLFARLRATSN